jgi:hypothetical protein
MLLIREREFDGEMHPPGKGLIHIFQEFGRQYDNPIIFFHFLEQVRGLDGGLSVVGVSDFGSFSEQAVGLVEE